ncbi:MAG: ATP-binding protein [Nocardioides sp.]
MSMHVGSGPRSVSIARRWVIEACSQIDRPDLAECAALGVSELVTNALLHAAPPIEVAIGGTQEHPRIEVSDQTPIPPSRRVVDPLSTTGRGVEIVAMCATMWGVEIDGEHKTVWFEPAADSDPSRVPSYTFHQTAVPIESSVAEGAEVTLLGVDVPQCQELQDYYAGLRRELRLLSLTREHDYPLATSLSDLFTSFDEAFPSIVLDQVQEAADRGQQVVDVRVRMSPRLPPLIPQIIEVLDLAEAFSRAQRLLTVSRTPDQLNYCHWFFGEFLRQSEGGQPLRFEDVASEQSVS